MDLLRLPRRRQGAERCRHEPRSHEHLPRRLCREGPRARDVHGGADPGVRGPLRHEAAHDQVRAHPRVQRPLLGRPPVGDRVHRRHGRGRSLHGHQDELPLPPHAREPRHGARTQPHGPLVDAPLGGLQALLRQDVHHHERDPVRERRPHARLPRRRLRHRLLRLVHAHRQGDAVLRRPREPRQVPPLRHQRRRGRGRGHAGRPEVPAGRGRRARLRRRRRQVQRHDGLALGSLREHLERHPLHARQVLLRARPDGAPRRARHALVRDGHRRPLRRGRLALRHQVRDGPAHPQRGRPRRRLRHRG